MKRKHLSELESCVLGVIWREGPSTAYQVRMAFAQSLTLIRKLKNLGLIKERPIPDDLRKTKILEVTENGLAEVRSWVANMPDWIADPAADTIRTRYYFLSSLSEDQRRSVLAAWITGSQDKISQLSSEIQRFIDRGDKVEASAHRGAMMQLQARVKWLKSIDDSSTILQG